MSLAPIPSLPMYFPSSTSAPYFNLTTAQTCSTLVGLAYNQFNVWVNLNYPDQNAFSSNTTWQQGGPSGFSYSVPIWSYFEILGDSFAEPFGFVAWDGNGNAYIVFRGTMTYADEYMDAEIDQTPYTFVNGWGNVHEGFMGIYQGLEQQLLQQINSLSSIHTVYPTGHSLGSGLSSLATPDMATNSNWASKAAFYHYNFASPRAGDPIFAAAMNGSGITTFRIVNTEDLIPDAPPSVSGSILYEHFGYPIDFSAQYGSIDGNHSMADCYSYAINNPNNPFNPNPTPFANVVTGKGIGTGRLPKKLLIPSSKR